MKNRLTGHLRGALALVVYAANTLFWVCPLFTIAGAKLVLPLNTWRRFCNRWLNRIVVGWVYGNGLNQRFISRVHYEVRGLSDVRPDQWYLVLSNHQSWADILILQKVFNRKIPHLKFFIKSELKWVPVLGWAWMALEFPFMKRYSQEKLSRKPKLRDRDAKVALRACAKLQSAPSAMMNFAEGTRFSRNKRDTQGSPHANLLRPKAGGASLVLGALGDRLHRVLNVTIAYPGQAGSFWDYLCGRMREVTILVEPITVGPELVGDYMADPEYRLRFQQWLNGVWADKDRKLNRLMGQ
ncbi:MAG: acyltransferase [Desulfarculaceae bacterium]|nr:acyltransferase [Desulfarculaceae bacterium]MCF8073447.1 acyltransferase [Desulfarculaceae bacterium]MCF8100406.1 acyltransferase [Desulfarculaceae bacterium]MCF8115858.1 acyltransferase [Desulfarculaceae bacterium]